MCKKIGIYLYSNCTNIRNFTIEVVNHSSEPQHQVGKIKNSGYQNYKGAQTKIKTKKSNRIKCSNDIFGKQK